MRRLHMHRQSRMHEDPGVSLHPPQAGSGSALLRATLRSVLGATDVSHCRAQGCRRHFRSRRHAPSGLTRQEGRPGPVACLPNAQKRKMLLEYSPGTLFLDFQNEEEYAGTPY